MKKFVSLFLALLTVLSLVACDSKTDTKTDDKSGGSTVTEPANALEKIKADGVLTVALSPDFSPMEFVDSSKIDQDQYVGFDVTLAKYIADGLGVKLQIEAMGFDASQTAVYTGSVPMSISGYSWTEERAKNYELSDYYYAGENETRQALLVKKENADKYTTPETLSGKDVGAQNASLQMQLVTEQLTGANPISIGDITVGVMELKSGNIEALAAITVAFGTVFASVLALMKMSKIPPLRWLSTIYIEIIRGTPMLLQLYFFYFGLPILIPALTKQKFLCMQEVQSAALLCSVMEQEGFAVEKGICSIPTAFSASYGSGKPIIGFLAEYDTLSGLSQAAGSTEYHQLVKGSGGHGLRS